MNTARIVLLPILAIAMFLGGCNTVPKAEYDAAIDENTDLRDQIAALQTNLDQAKDANEAYATQNNELRSRNSTLESQLAQSSTTGFEGIDGIDVDRRARGEVVVGVESDILFNSGSADLLKNAKETLDRVARVLNSEYSSNEIRVEGYTDTDPLVKTKNIWKTNENLSAARALSVESYLVSKGVNNDRIYSAAFGPSKQKGSKKASRRVEIVILGS
jgi:chemotaxis protein MotB